MYAMRFVAVLVISWLVTCSVGCKAVTCDTSQLKQTIQRDITTSEISAISDIEKSALVRVAEYPDVPQRPFGYRNKDWLVFKQQYLSGDCLIHFITGEDSWKKLSGLEGYAIIRGDEVVDIFLLKVN